MCFSASMNLYIFIILLVSIHPVVIRETVRNCSVCWYLLRLALCSTVCSILENLPMAAEEEVWAVFELGQHHCLLSCLVCSILKSDKSLLDFCLGDLCCWVRCWHRKLFLCWCQSMSLHETGFASWYNNTVSMNYYPSQFGNYLFPLPTNFGLKSISSDVVSSTRQHVVSLRFFLRAGSVLMGSFNSCSSWRVSVFFS